MAVAAESGAFLTNDQGELAVGLEANDSVNHVNTRRLELASPSDVVLLIESGFDFNQSQNLLAGLCGINQRINNWRVTAGAIESLLDGQNLRISSSLLQKSLRAGCESFVWVVNQNLALANGRKDVRRFIWIRFQVTVGGDLVWFKMKLWSLHERDGAETLEV